MSSYSRVCYIVRYTELSRKYRGVCVYVGLTLQFRENYVMNYVMRTVERSLTKRTPKVCRDISVVISVKYTDKPLTTEFTRRNSVLRFRDNTRPPEAVAGREVPYG